MKQHDILLEVGGNEIPSALPDFLKLMESLKGKAFDFSVMRGGRFITVKGIKFPSWTPQPVVESGPRKETYSVRVRSDVFMGYYHGSAGRIIVQGRLENNKPAPTKISIYFDNFRQQFTDINDIPQKYRKFVRKLLPIGGLR